MIDNSTSDYYYLSAYKIQLPRETTEPGMAFIREHCRLLEFLKFIFQVLSFSDFVDKDELFNEWVQTLDEEHHNQLRSEEIDALPFGVHQQLLGELILTRAIENFLVYVTDLLIAVIKTQPKMLKSSESESLEFIFQFATMDELVAAVVEKKVNELSYKASEELSKYFKDHLGLELFDTEEVKQHIVRLIEMRNIIVHARGIVNQTFKRRVKGFAAKTGEQLNLNYVSMMDETRFLATVVYQFDKKVADKFGIATIPIRHEEVKNLLLYVKELVKE